MCLFYILGFWCRGLKCQIIKKSEMPLTKDFVLDLIQDDKELMDAAVRTDGFGRCAGQMHAAPHAVSFSLDVLTVIVLPRRGWAGSGCSASFSGLLPPPHGMGTDC